MRVFSIDHKVRISCSQLCGLAHYRMRGMITVEPEAAFQKFLANEAAALK
jgi:heme/copper-type cytochrome/quinol oxidase subunit 2